MSRANEDVVTEFDCVALIHKAHYSAANLARWRVWADRIPRREQMLDDGFDALPQSSREAGEDQVRVGLGDRAAGGGGEVAS